MIRIQQLKMPLSHNEEALLQKIKKTLRIQDADIISWKIVRQSVDARKKPMLQYVYTIDLKVRHESTALKKANNKNIMLTNETKYRFPKAGAEELRYRPVVIGSGPAGLFCAYMLAKYGYCPLVVERGDEARVRKEKVDVFWNGGSLDPQSNVQFGEGGAGTFSDGKLNTSVKDSAGRNRKVLEIFVEAGAPAEILYQQKPHLGTDLLIQIVQTIRRQIEDMGGEFRFRCQMTDLQIEDQAITGIGFSDGSFEPAQVVVCATGHSARDTYEMLYRRGISMSSKAFAVGVRIEHQQKMINLSQYGQETVSQLGAANYKLTQQLSSGRGLYSFCMCPGGFVVNASSEMQSLAINGMSYHDRDSENANSAMIITISPEDYLSYKEEVLTAPHYGHSANKEEVPDVLSGIDFQRYLERKAFSLEKGKIPVQLFGDFLKKEGSISLGTISPCMKGEWTLSNLHECLPEFLCQSLAEGITALDKKISGFGGYDTLLSGVESRSSSPVRIHRDGSMEANISGFYPCGEGAGYAGGITSAAIDGLKVAEAIRQRKQRIIKN